MPVFSATSERDKSNCLALSFIRSNIICKYLSKVPTQIITKKYKNTVD
ncbi:L-seryl-tRNA(Sec) selenium transferase [Lactobacillus phage S16]|nr:L-seryl-tRNA(Sec) selenium transferase [Lactobacillus phage S16]